jgi:hypothetical protein
MGGMNKNKPSTDYETYKEIMEDLLTPIASEGIDPETLKRLYESKMVYLENLRAKCFKEVNRDTGSHFTHTDYELIVRANAETRKQLRHVILAAIQVRLSNIRSA